MATAKKDAWEQCFRNWSRRWLQRFLIVMLMVLGLAGAVHLYCHGMYPHLFWLTISLGALISGLAVGSARLYAMMLARSLRRRRSR